jgi:hypothetical protein
MPAWVSRRVEAVLDNAVIATISIVAVSLASAFGLKKLIDAESAAVVGLFVAVCLAIIWNQLAQIVARHAERRRERLTPADIERTIWEWLKRYQFKLKVAPNPGCDFSLNAEMEGNAPGVTIIKLSATPWITILTNLTFEEKERDLVKKRAPLLRKDMGITLVQFGVELDMQFDPQDRLASIQIRKLMPFDASTTELTLLTAIAQVRGGAKIAAEMHNRVTEQARLGGKSTP